jgi:hypothetical protein
VTARNIAAPLTASELAPPHFAARGARILALVELHIVPALRAS